MSSHDGKRCKGNPTRREFMRVGAIGGLGLTLGDYFHLREAQAAQDWDPKAKSVIFIFLAGGLSHIDTFDPKPFAPIEYRGELGITKTNTGEEFSGLCKNLAGIDFPSIQDLAA